MLEKNELLKLSIATARASKKNPVAYSYNGKNFSYQDLNTTFRKELNELAKDPYEFERNKLMIFELVNKTIDDVLPQRVIEQYGMFANIQHFAQGVQPVFKQSVTEVSKRRAKRFVTKVGLAGVYETFRLAGKSYTVQTTAYGGAARIELEEFLDGTVDWGELINLVMEGLDEAVYKEIAQALIASINTLQSINKTTQTNFDETEMDRLLAIADAYGKASIYCTFEFAATMLPNNAWVSDSMKDQVWNNGYIANYKGHNVIVLKQSYTDETNSTKVIDPSYAWIIPAGAAKPVDIAFEGQTLSKTFENRDWSTEFQTYTKFGVAARVNNDLCVYQNTSLSIKTQLPKPPAAAGP